MLLTTVYFILVALGSQTSGAKLLELKQIDTAEKPEKALIFLHGLGADFNDFSFFPELLKQQTKNSWRVILPNANIQAISVNNGYEMRAWYDIYTMDLTNKDDTQGINQSVSDIIEIIDNLVEQGFDTKDIFIGGFSQGGVISLVAMNSYKQPLAGIIALSTYLPTTTKLSKSEKINSIFMAHGINDPVINIKYSKESKTKLQQNNQKIIWRSYNMEHSLVQEELDDLIVWINSINNENTHSS